MRMRSAAVLSVSVCSAGAVSAAPDEFDFFAFSIAAGAGGAVGGFPLGPDVDFESVEMVGPGVLSVSESDGLRTVEADLAYDVVVSAPDGDTLSIAALFTSTIDLAFDPGDTSGSLEAFASLDSIIIEFTLTEASFLEISGLGGEVIGLGGTPDFGNVSPGIVTLDPGSYAFERFTGTDIDERSASPTAGQGTYVESLSFGLTLTAVPAPSTAALLGLGGAAMLRRRRTG